MKKVICGMLMALLLVAAIGCGGGAPAPVGKTMTQDEINQLYSDMTTAQTAFNAGSGYIPDPTGTRAASISANILKTKAVSTYTWNGPDNLGWYETIQTEYTFRIRFIEATNTIEFSQSYQMTLGVTMTITNSFSLSKNNNLWSGNATTTMAFSTGETMKVEVSFNGVDEIYGCGTFDMWMTVTGGSSPMSRTQYAHFTVSYDSAHGTTPILVTGWYGFGASKVTFEADHWVAITP